MKWWYETLFKYSLGIWFENEILKSKKSKQRFSANWTRWPNTQSYTLLFETYRMKIFYYYSLTSVQLFGYYQLTFYLLHSWTHTFTSLTCLFILGFVRLKLVIMICELMTTIWKMHKNSRSCKQYSITCFATIWDFFPETKCFAIRLDLVTVLLTIEYDISYLSFQNIWKKKLFWYVDGPKNWPFPKQYDLTLFH